MSPNDEAEYRKRLLAGIGIDDPSVADLDESQIRSLTEPRMFDGECYDALTPEQIEGVIRMKRRGFTLPSVPPEYWLTTKRLIDPRTRTERANAEGKKKALTLIVDLGSRLFMTAAISVILGLFVKEAMNDDVSSAIAKIITRLWSFMTSSFFGYMLGCKLNDIDAEYIRMRVETHLEYLEDKDYVFKTAKEEAKEHYLLGQVREVPFNGRCQTDDDVVE
jgi:hypothetical protein